MNKFFPASAKLAKAREFLELKYGKYDSTQVAIP